MGKDDRVVAAVACVCVCVCEGHHGGATGMCVLCQTASATRQTVISQEIPRGVTNVDDLTPARLCQVLCLSGIFNSCPPDQELGTLTTELASP